MNGAESLIRSLTGSGVRVCFANPGTSEMHLVQAIDAEPDMRAVLALFEGVCTGAADGYGRLTGIPATTLLHLGPGLGNGIANLHNARRAGTPVINLVGNHARQHVRFDAPLTSDIDTLAKNVSSWCKSDSTSESLASDGMAALQSARTVKPGSLGGVSTLIVPADACWGEASGTAEPLEDLSPEVVDDRRIRGVAEKLGADSLILLDREGLTLPARIAAGRIQARTGARVAITTFPARVDGGPGTPVFERLPYFPEQILASLSGVRNIILAGAEAPVSFFAYPGIPSLMVPEGCEVIRLAEGHEAVTAALEHLADELGASEHAETWKEEQASMPTGKLTVSAIASMVARYLPENAVLCGDSGGGGAVFVPVQRSRPNTWLNLTGGSIGQGGPCAVGAAIARPESRVLALLGDGAVMYTNQALWTQAREGLDVTTVIFSNRKYGILETEYLRLGVNRIGERAGQLFDLSNPAIDYVALGASMGVPGKRVMSCESFAVALQQALSEPGPGIIEAVL